MLAVLNQAERHLGHYPADAPLAKCCQSTSPQTRTVFQTFDSGPEKIEEFASSLIVALNTYPVVAGSITEPADAKWHKPITLVETWGSLPSVYRHAWRRLDLVARSVFNNGDFDATLLMGQIHQDMRLCSEDSLSTPSDVFAFSSCAA